MTGDLVSLSARAVRDRLKDRQVTPLELLDALEARISEVNDPVNACLLYTSPSPRDATLSRMPSSA